MGGEEGGRVKVCSGQLRTNDRSIKRFFSGCCPIISCPGEPRGAGELKLPCTILRSYRRESKSVHGVVPGAGGRDREGGSKQLTKVIVASLRSASLPELPCHR